MRIDNRKVKNTIISIYFILLVLAVMLGTVFQSQNMFDGSSMYVLFGLMLAVLIVHFVSRYFEYDSDGQNLIVTNQGLILTDYINYRENKIEIAKNKVVGFKINNLFFYKTLVIISENKNGKLSKDRFNVTLLKAKKRKYVKQSLIKIIKENKMHK